MLVFLAAHPLWLVPVIFLARVADVSLGTLRTIMVFRGYRFRAAFLGFFEVLIWLMAAGQVFHDLDAWYLSIAYAAGYAMGNIVGSWLEAKVAIGLELVRIISLAPATDLAGKLSRLGYDVTELAAVANASRDVEILLVVERRRRVPSLLRLVSELDPDAVCTVSDVKRPAAPRLGRSRRSFLQLPDARRVSKRK